MKILKLPRPATVEDLYDVEGKAEIINGQIVLMGGNGVIPSWVAMLISRSLVDYRGMHGGGRPLMEVICAVDLPHRQSFQPDVCWYVGPMIGKHAHGAPPLAIEIRNEGDYGLRAEREMKAKRADYFAAGTLVVWDVDVLREGVVRVYRADDPEHPTVYRRGEVAEAEPAVPGWRMPVDELFD
jgi:Uma2 family endonuclease